MLTKEAPNNIQNLCWHSLQMTKADGVTSHQKEPLLAQSHLKSWLNIYNLKNAAEQSTNHPGKGREGVHLADADWKLKSGLN